MDPMTTASMSPEPHIARRALPFSVVTKPTGATCNLDCTYCFFLSKDLLYPNASSLMSPEVLEQYIRQSLQSQPGPTADLIFQGGEPTMRGLDFYKQAVAYVAQYRRPGQSVQLSMQTNGTLLNDAWCEFLKENNFLVGLSIDGPKEMHDEFRVNKAGRGTFDQVVRGWNFLCKHDVDTNILSTVHSANADYPLEVYRFFRDELGAEYLQFIPIIERVEADQLAQAEAGWNADAKGTRLLYLQRGDAVTSRSVRPEQYGAFLSAIFDEWVRNDIGTMYVQMFDVMLGAKFGQYSLCVHAPECGSAGALEHNGDVYSCDHFVEPNYLLGNLMSTPLPDLMSGERQQSFGRAKRDALPNQCVECPVRWACHGGCPKDRFIATADGEAGLNYLCSGFQQFFTHATPEVDRMAELLRMGGAPSSIMAELRG